MGGIHLPGLLSGPADDYVTTKWPPALPSLPAKTHTNRGFICYDAITKERQKQEKKIYPPRHTCCVVCWGMLREEVQRFRTSGSAFEHFNPRARLLCRPYRQDTHKPRVHLL